ncbi:protocatechuate 3,4-dioxygenase subunit alpha [Sabulicella glaciei]|uniref:Protocatechuate 3,4-dioxygenase subunit alpha n=1 Tax=Sabulicella glaciei TaxID=2984948 RepID=A0ABT3NQJ9_9PROT|nr:protocatechuate 3,4-dioxygenase subunit alpha [Roseococcus sp. MDT2-1-1]MCW8084431.1 protocatechuate 3,4-dioxygenase subunit alpha [Roseococcus sp. MDT2-1-1]
MSTAHQTVGPYWHLLEYEGWNDLLREDGPNTGMAAEAITLAGRVTDGAGAPVTDAQIEIWQAGPDGRYDGSFHGFGRARTDEAGRFRFRTVKPSPVPGRGNATQAPHIQLQVFARGLLRHLTTRAYFAGEALNGTDPLLAVVPEERRGTLIAQPGAPGEWVLDIRLRGDGETVFLDI